MGKADETNAVQSNCAEIEGAATIKFRTRYGYVHTWTISCHLKADNDETFRAHLARWYPDAEFISATIQPVKRAT